MLGGRARGRRGGDAPGPGLRDDGGGAVPGGRFDDGAILDDDDRRRRRRRRARPIPVPKPKRQRLKSLARPDRDPGEAHVPKEGRARRMDQAGAGWGRGPGRRRHAQPVRARARRRPHEPRRGGFPHARGVPRHRALRVLRLRRRPLRRIRRDLLRRRTVRRRRLRDPAARAGHREARHEGGDVARGGGRPEAGRARVRDGRRGFIRRRREDAFVGVGVHREVLGGVIPRVCRRGRRGRRRVGPRRDRAAEGRVEEQRGDVEGRGARVGLGRRGRKGARGFVADADRGVCENR
mmetsp:Transcript_6351/g.25828  ORF Transcript_6351/g.25828 Transcript_6351/m.25828 type:complete len:293 (+) Transcript_6351:281-1159(+)